MSIFRKLRRAMRGEVALRTALLESGRRTYAATRRRGERRRLQAQANQPARLTTSFASLSAKALLDHFRQRAEPHFFSGFDLPLPALAASQRTVFPEDSAALLADAERIANERCWPLLGLANHRFVDWHRDPLSGFDWPLEFYGEINLLRNDGSDVRLVWELNRLGHFLKLARGYALSGDERLSVEFFRQVESWDTRNPIGFGVNWNCAMEVALRAQNLFGAFAVFRRAPDFDSEKLALLLRIFDQHGRFIREHLEFSYIVTSNHYLADVVGLLWLGIMLPELEDAASWRDFGLRELLREMDKQVLPDGADCESSTGYHRLVLEFFAYSFLLCRENAIEIDSRYWQKLRQMFGYLRAYLRPDGLAPLIGDSDSGQVFPISRRPGNDHSYLLGLGAVLFDDPRLKPEALPTPELLWMLGEDGLAKYQAMTTESLNPASQPFPDAGIYVLRNGDDYLLLNASGAGLNGRGSHGHNDALSIEVSACGRPFIVDPGTYVYTADLEERQLFRSTAYHSTVQIDDVEQNETSESSPFVIGNEAQPQLVSWFPDAERGSVSAEHYGYKRLTEPITHRRTATFRKHARVWLIEDEFFGTGEHKFATRFHFDSGLEAIRDGERVQSCDPASGHKLFICPLDLSHAADLESQYTSRDYGQKMESTSACWTIQSPVPAKLRWALVPVCADDDESRRLQVVTQLLGALIN
ncbi:MAG TPA: alginate lyase family protein [Pyrinomonadaceae bacterium]|nr:alginate lyase family protein [Pyrinomonadaceae bacterium]